MIAFQATKRGLTDRETTMEDTHVWVMNADGTDRREIGRRSTTGRARRSGRRTGRSALHGAGARARAAVSRVPLDGGAAEAIVSERGAVGAFSVGKDTLAYALTTPSDLAELYVRVGAARAARKSRTSTRRSSPASRCAEVEPFTFVSNDNKFAGRSVPDEAGRPDRRRHEVPAHREHPRRPARPAGARVQLQEPGVRGARAGRR